jgi:hypothetical protein
MLSDINQRVIMADHKTIQVDTKYIHLRLGGLLQQVLTPYELAHTNTVTIQVANETWYGNFTVPMAVGFSTPVSLLKGGHLSIHMSHELYDPTFVTLFQQWSSVFSGEGVRKMIRQTLTSDKLTCPICLQDYVVGDQIHQLDSCGHIFHNECLGQWILTKCQLCQNYGSFRFHCAHMSSTLVSNATQCPICRMETII